MLELDYSQRKALRRMARGGSIPRRMIEDPVISQCFEWSVPTAPPKPVAEMDIIEYCDWEFQVKQAYPVLNNYGRTLLDTLPVVGGE